MSAALTSTKPYMLRAMHEWCVDNGLTPYLVVAVDGSVRVPRPYVKDGQIVLNIHYTATKNLLIDNEAISFSARFGGVATDIYVPVQAVRAIYARENGEGMFFEPSAEKDANIVDATCAEEVAEADAPEPPPPGPGKRPALKLVK